MIPNPIHKVLSTFQSCQVRALLMGGQACVFYGGAEFSRGTDFAILADTENLERLRTATNALQAEVIACRRCHLSICMAVTQSISAAGTLMQPGCASM